MPDFTCCDTLKIRASLGNIHNQNLHFSRKVGLDSRAILLNFIVTQNTSGSLSLFYSFAKMRSTKLGGIVPSYNARKTLPSFVKHLTTSLTYRLVRKLFFRGFCLLCAIFGIFANFCIFDFEHFLHIFCVLIFQARIFSSYLCKYLAFLFNISRHIVVIFLILPFLKSGFLTSKN